jgi:hypothetical protein
MDESPGAQKERRDRKATIARKDALLDRIASLAAANGRLAHDADDEELLLVAEELAEWVERVRAERPETE